GLQEFRDGVWHQHPILEMEAEFQGLSTVAIPPVPLQITKQGRILVLLPGKLIEFSFENPDEPRTTILRTANTTPLQKFLGMSVARDGTVWISGAHGVAHSGVPARGLKPDSTWQDYLLPSMLQVEDLDQPITDIESDGLTCVAGSKSSEQRF